MEHAEIQGKLSAYLDNAVSAEEKAEIKRHLGTCGSCRVAIADLELTVGYLRSLPDVEPPPWLTSKIMAIVGDETVRKPGLWRRLFFPLHVKLPIEVVALVLLCVTGYYLSRTIDTQNLTSSSPKQKQVPPNSLPTKAPTAASSAPSSETRNKMAPVTDSLPQSPSPNPVQQEEEPSPAPALPSRPMHEPELRPADEGFMEPSLGKEEKSAHKAMQRNGKSPEYGSAPAAGAPQTSTVGKEEVFLAVDNPSTAARAIEESVTRVGGSINGRSYSEESHLLFIRIGVQKVPGLLARLDQIGKLQERPKLSGSSGGIMELIIRW